MSDAFLAGSAGRRYSRIIHGWGEEGSSTEDSFCLPLLQEPVWKFRKKQQDLTYFLSASNFLGAYNSDIDGKNNSKVAQRCILFWMCFFHPWLNSREQQQRCVLSQHCPKVLLNLSSFCSYVSRCSSLLFSAQSLSVLPCLKDCLVCTLWWDVSNPSMSCGTAFVLRCTSDCSRLFEISCPFHGHHSLWLSHSTAVDASL